MGVLLGRTSRIKSGYMPVDFMPAAATSILQSVQVSIPQQGFTAIKQVRSREMMGTYRFNERQGSVSFAWLVNLEDAEAKFLKYIDYFQKRANGIVIDPITEPDTFSFVSSVSYRQSGLNPPQFEVELVFLNCPNIYSEEFDPVEFFIDKDSEVEASIQITEDLNSTELVTERSFSMTMRGDYSYGLKGYRSFKFSEVMLSESITSVDSEYIPDWKYDAYIVPETSIEAHNRSLGAGSGPRTYTTSRQAHLKTSAASPYVTLGWN